MRNKYIIKNQEHGSNILISVVYDYGDCVEIVKTSVDEKSKKSLENELIGYSWYHNRGGLIVPRIIKNNNQFFSISIPYVNGKTKNPIYGYTINKRYIKLMISSYKEIWSKDKLRKNAPFHGDFSIGNMIYRDGKINFIDWEHFAKGRFPIGIDLLNLLFEQLWFEKRIIGIRKRTLNEIFLLIKDLVNEGYLLYKERSYLSYLVSIININKDHWGGQIKKMPILKFTDSEIRFIDDYFHHI